MKTAQDIINNARFDLATHIITLMRRLDAYFVTGKKNLMTAPEEEVVIDFAGCVAIPAILVEVDNLKDKCYEPRALDFITTGDDHNFYVSVDDTDIDADDISTDELVFIAKILEDTYANAKEV